MTKLKNPACQTQQILAAKLRLELKLRKMHMKDLAENIGVSEGYMVKVFNGHSTMSLAFIEKVFEALGLGEPVISGQRHQP